MAEFDGAYYIVPHTRLPPSLDATRISQSLWSTVQPHTVRYFCAHDAANKQHILFVLGVAFYANFREPVRGLRLCPLYTDSDHPATWEALESTVHLATFLARKVSSTTLPIFCVLPKEEGSADSLARCRETILRDTFLDGWSDYGKGDVLAWNELSFTVLQAHAAA